jgi:hypothetical protein
MDNSAVTGGIQLASLNLGLSPTLIQLHLAASSEADGAIR